MLLQAPGDNTGSAQNKLFLLPDAEKQYIYTLTALRKPLGDLGGLGGRAHDGLSSLPVEEKAVTWSWCALAMGFLPACRGKGPLMD